MALVAYELYGPSKPANVVESLVVEHRREATGE
jgi:hypothetical protein